MSNKNNDDNDSNHAIIERALTEFIEYLYKYDISKNEVQNHVLNLILMDIVRQKGTLQAIGLATTAIINMIEHGPLLELENRKRIN